ncbi:MAG: M23 family metallopeptidase [Candidatus Zixiibacteriota bacterium]
MLKKRIILWFLPDNYSDAKQISIPRIWLYCAPGIFVAILLGSLVLLSTFFGDRVNKSELKRLKAENQFLAEKYEKIRWTLSEAESRFTDLVNKEIAIRTLFNLPEINVSERQLGIGGPGPLGFASMTETQQDAVLTESQVDRLLKVSEFELSKFGEVEAALTGLKDRLDHTPSINPTQGWASRGYGMHYDPFTGYRQMHRGVDIANHAGTPIVAPATGKVVYAGKDPGGLGNLIAVDHGFGFLTRFGHLSKIQVRNGQSVARGEVLGLMGSTGYSTGPHLHYEVWRNGKPLDPREFILNGM